MADTKHKGEKKHAGEKKRDNADDGKGRLTQERYDSASGNYRIPVVSIVGKSDSGKTSVLERLVRELVTRGYRVATVKHHVHAVDIDVPGKDSWRHARAGATVTMISSPSQFVVARAVERERSLAEIVEAAGDVDIVVTEGFLRAGACRIEVSRRARSQDAILRPFERFALVTDNPDLDPGDRPVFGLEDARGLADLVEATFLSPTADVSTASAEGAGGDMLKQSSAGTLGGDERFAPLAASPACGTARDTPRPLGSKELSNGD